MAKKQKKKLNPEDYEAAIMGPDLNTMLFENLDKEGKGAVGKRISEKRKHKLVETSPGKYTVVKRKKSGGIVSSKSIAKKYFKGGMV